MKGSYLSIIAVILVVAAMLVAGCSSTNSAGAQPTSGSSGTSSGSAAVTPASASSGTCPAVTPAASWSGKWVSWSNSDPCFDGRVYFYPPTTDHPAPWDDTVAGVEDFPVTFTQTGCDVTGSITVGPNSTLVAPPGCPITLTGKIDSTGAISGTWKAYCDLPFSYSDKTLDSGAFNLNMEPGGSTFVGKFTGTDPAMVSSLAGSCPNANSNWVGKRG